MNEDVKSENVRIHSRADELIACLEGEIAKRDEELAACRVAVENCELFRARIAELEDLVISLQCKAIESDDLRAELAAIKAQEPAFMWHKGATEDESEVVDVDCACPCCVPLYAAPVSEAKAQGDAWAPSVNDYDHSIHSNPDAREWADFFVATFPGLADKHDLMIGWFANAMMAMHDHLARKAQGVVMPRNIEKSFLEWASAQLKAPTQLAAYMAGADEVARLNAALYAGKEVQ